MCGGASPKDKMEQEGGEATPEGTIEGRQSHPRRGVAAPKDAIESGAARPPQKGKYMGGVRGRLKRHPRMTALEVLRTLMTSLYMF